MAHKTPCVKDGLLIYTVERVQRSLVVESEEWWSWLRNGDGLFRFECDPCLFTARREYRHAGAYWYAYHTQNKKKDKVYIGKSEDLTLMRLQLAADELAARNKPGSTAPSNAFVHRTSVPEPKTDTITPLQMDTRVAQAAKQQVPNITSSRDSSAPGNRQLPTTPLTGREHEIMACLAVGMSNKEIAQHLILTKSTVKWYLEAIYSKLHVRSRSQAIASVRVLYGAEFYDKAFLKRD